MWWAKLNFMYCVVTLVKLKKFSLTFQAPDEVDRQSMLEALFWKVTSDSNIDLERIAKKTAVSMNDILRVHLTVML